MKKSILMLLAAGVLGWSCNNAGKAIKVTVENPSDFDRSVEMVEVPASKLGGITLAEGQAYVVTDKAGEIVPSQVTYDGNLIFMAGTGAGESEVYTIVAGEATEFPSMTYGRFVPERLDDFVWENDRVAFRTYGPALIAKDGPSTGIDAWYKRTPKLVVDEWYADELAGVKKYHDDHGEGMDDYSVGPTLGAGAPALYVDGVMYKNKNFTDFQVFENGPLRTTFRLVYDDVDMDGNKVYEYRTISLDAGSQFNEITVNYGVNETVDMVAGFPMRQLTDEYITGDDYIIYIEPPTAKADGVWLGIVMPGMKETAVNTYTVPEGQKQAGDYHHILAVKEYTPGTPVTYYAGFGWELWGYPTVDEFKALVEKTASAVSNPLKVTID